jgi:hypothetical protein
MTTDRRSWGTAALVFLFVAPGALARGPSPAETWIARRQLHGGLAVAGSPHSPADPANLATTRSLLGKAMKDPAALASFRDAYYFAFGVHGAGGLDFTSGDAVLFASRLGQRSDPANYLRVFRHAFHEACGDFEPVSDAAKSAYAEANRQAATGELPKAPAGASIRGLIVGWLKKPRAACGAGLPEERAGEIADRILRKDGQGEGYKKLLALREAFFLGIAKPAAGGMSVSFDQALENAELVAGKPGALELAEKLRADYRRRLLEFSGEDFDAHRRKVIAELFATLGASTVRVAPIGTHSSVPAGAGTAL